MKFLIYDTASLVIEGWTEATAAPDGKQLIPLQPFEESYITANLKPYTDPDSGAWLYAFSATLTDSVMDLQAGGCIRRRTAAELAADPTHPAYPTLHVHITISGGDGRTPPGAHVDNSNPLTFDFEVRNDADEIVPIGGTDGYVWRIPIYNKLSVSNGLDIWEDVDTLAVELVNGVGSVTFASDARTFCRPYYLSSRAFSLVRIGEVYHQIKIVEEPVVFKVYR